MQATFVYFTASMAEASASASAVNSNLNPLLAALHGRAPSKEESNKLTQPSCQVATHLAYPLASWVNAATIRSGSNPKKLFEVFFGCYFSRGELWRLQGFGFFRKLFLFIRAFNKKCEISASYKDLWSKFVQSVELPKKKILKSCSKKLLGLRNTLIM